MCTNRQRLPKTFNAKLAGAFPSNFFRIRKPWLRSPPLRLIVNRLHMKAMHLYNLDLSCRRHANLRESRMSICFPYYEESAFSTPCGNLFCSQCVMTHLSSTSADGFTDSFNCASQFPIGQFKLHLIPYLVADESILNSSYTQVSQVPTSTPKLVSRSVQVKPLPEKLNQFIVSCLRHV
ncbi:hypothetical protein ARMGADRAFT_518113 [Armillaria gallica]|uniref:Zinc finger C3HC4 RING-type domain-containing protein n=1 Tax=Armillaria gallica TaxID=47427 RepID=A0A2H3EL12_ARMGA|nr:hypothetical protein ARMGADRAFT_518113 [Armillaria gallica]